MQCLTPVRLARLVLAGLALTLSLPASPASQQCDRSRFAIAIDAGHTAAHPGATSARGTPEFEFNTRLAATLVPVLEGMGFAKVFQTNENGADISLTDRSGLANRRGADLFLSLHHDSVQPRYLSAWTYQDKPQQYSDSFSGYSIFFSGQNRQPDESLRFARVLGSELRKQCLRPTLHHAEKIEGESRELVDPDLGIYQFDALKVLATTKMPAVLFEAGVIVNRAEEIRLEDPAYRKRIAESIGAAIARFCAGDFGATTASARSCLPP
ncbi:N-acetylmuramoyl-L-alanine amidase [Cupriavidus sp. CuC1]|uniref:N-acetylmuramoyl-L-alanine amidase n=1 Tax=Cupriavidus sp. CuC1 TaxID=3373131 RepID=UPI0037D5FDA8